MFFKKQSRLANQRCTIFTLEDEAALKATPSSKKQKQPIYLIITTLDDDIKIYKIQLPRRIRDTHTVMAVNMGNFNPATFFQLFETGDANSIIRVPVFANLTWQDCFLLFEVFVMNQYMSCSGAPRAKRAIASREKVVDMTKCITKFVDEESEKYRNNLLTTYNAHLLVYYHIWYLYNHQRLEVFSHTWQATLQNRHYLNSYRLVCNLPNISDILAWIYNNNVNNKMRSNLRVKRLEHGPFTFGPFDYHTRSKGRDLAIA